MKNCVKNDGGVVKIHARQAYEESLALAVRHGKMTGARKEELLAKIERVASNDATAFAGTESDIKVTKNSKNGEIVIDMVAHYMRTDNDRPNLMHVSYTTALGVIRNATIHQLAKVDSLVREILSTTLKGMYFPGGDAERAQVARSLEGLANC